MELALVNRVVLVGVVVLKLVEHVARNHGGKMAGDAVAQEFDGFVVGLRGRRLAGPSAA